MRGHAAPAACPGESADRNGSTFPGVINDANEFALCIADCGGTTCTLLSSSNAVMEQALLNALHMYFAGTSSRGTLNPPGKLGFASTIMNNATPVSNAPLN